MRERTGWYYDLLRWAWPSFLSMPVWVVQTDDDGYIAFKCRITPFGVKPYGDAIEADSLMGIRARLPRNLRRVKGKEVEEIFANRPGTEIWVP